MNYYIRLLGPILSAILCFFIFSKYLSEYYSYIISAVESNVLNVYNFLLEHNNFILLIGLFFSIIALTSISIFNNAIIYTLTMFITASILKILFSLLGLWLPFSLALVWSGFILTVSVLIKNELFSFTLSLLPIFTLALFFNYNLMFDINCFYLVDYIQVSLSEIFSNIHLSHGQSSSNPSVKSSSDYSTIVAPTPTLPQTGDDQEGYQNISRSRSPGTGMNPEMSYEAFNKSKGISERIEQDIIDYELETKTHVSKAKHDILTEGFSTAGEVIGKITGGPEGAIAEASSRIFRRYAESRSPSPTVRDSKESNVGAALFLLVSNKTWFSHFKSYFLFYLVYGFYYIFGILFYFNFFKFNSVFKTYFSSRFPVSSLSTSYEYHLNLYNIIVILFSSFILIYFIVSFIYIILYFKNNKDFYNVLFEPSNNKNNLLLTLYKFLKFNFVLIFIFTAVFYFYFNLSTDFAINATHGYNIIFNEEVRIYYYIGSTLADNYVFSIFFISKLFLGYIWTSFIIKYSNLTFVKFNRGSRRTIEFINKDNIIIRILIIGLIFAYVNYIFDLMSHGLLIEPYNLSIDNYTLGEVIVGNNISHFYLFVSTITMITCFYFLKYVNYILGLDDSRILFGKRDIFLLIKGILLITFSLSYHTLLISTLWMFVHYVPGGFIVITSNLPF